MKNIIESAQSFDELLNALQEVLLGHRGGIKDLAIRIGLDVTQDFRGADLRKIRLKGEDLSGFDFAGADLRGADLRGTKLQPQQLVNANLNGARLDKVQLNDPAIHPAQSTPPLAKSVTASRKNIKRQREPVHNYYAMPKYCEELLVSPIDDDVAKSAKTTFGSYQGWEADHWETRRFYVHGLRWLSNSTGINAHDLYSVRDLAIERARERLFLSNDVRARSYLNRELTKNHVGDALHGRPISFGHAAQVIVACEFALRRMFDRRGVGSQVPAEIESPERVYGFLGVIPACWYIEALDMCYLELFREGNRSALQKLAASSGLESPQTILNLAKGFTVTRTTAQRIWDNLQTEYRISGVDVGPIRAHPGIRSVRLHKPDRDYRENWPTALGQGHASPTERAADSLLVKSDRIQQGIPADYLAKLRSER